MISMFSISFLHLKKISSFIVQIGIGNHWNREFMPMLFRRGMVSTFYLIFFFFFSITRLDIRPYQSHISPRRMITVISTDSKYFSRQSSLLQYTRIDLRTLMRCKLLNIYLSY